METPTETPAAAPSAPAAELSLDQIVGDALKAADAAGETVVQPETVVASDDKPAAGDKPDKTPEAAPAETPAEEPAEPKTTDEISAARARKILETVEAKLADVDRRERALTEREAGGVKNLLAELLKAPKAFLAKHGAHIDDLIDASVAEGKVEAPAASPEDDRIAALEKRIADRERAEQEARNASAIAARKAEIHAEIGKSTKFPVLNETKRHSLVTDYMVAYHEQHGTPISWDKAAAAVESDLTGIGIAAAKKLGWQPPAAKAAPAPAKERTASPTLAGAVSDNAAATADAELPEDPNRLLDFLVRKAQAAG